VTSLRIFFKINVLVGSLNVAVGGGRESRDELISDKGIELGPSLMGGLNLSTNSFLW
jgi:hypothetical protein